MRATLSAFVLAMACAGTAVADRAPTPEETARISVALEALGYKSWDEIELEDDDADGPYWEVDDARDADGVEWDLRLDVEDLTVIDVERD
ncbi:PepSY domain-containing protein [Pikeienuella piscinae]|uniref:PepSY domain-containing protein n=1 Tax=Pikeienuella piscinae TaxID=2748098 RepID=A0A7L5BYY9_9RHOB|nr:PepSY domain-containing protein [Pikeienuella piscinae]QIE54819.1 PepSY domain-containing protein [Pikeienuella piscinae]